MLDRLREAIPKDFIDNELAELREHRLRFGLLIFSMAVLVIFLILDDSQSDPPNQLVEETPTVESEPSVEPIDRRTEIIGLARAAEDAPLINPFAVDLPKPPPAPEPVIIPVAAPPPPPPLSIHDKKILPPPEPAPHIMLTLKGTAISDDKKIAVVHREFVTPKSSADEQSDRRVENRLLKIGEEIDGRKVVDIGKNFVAFDDGARLELPRIQSDD